MRFKNTTARHYHRWLNWYQREISHPQLLVLYVAANYKLRLGNSGWWAVGYQCRDNYVRTHSPSVIKSLLKDGYLEGNSCGEKVGVEDWTETSTKETPVLWTSAKGIALLDTITIQTGLVFDKVNYQLVEPGYREDTDGFELGYFNTEQEADLALDRAGILLEGDDVPTHFPPEESENVIFCYQVIRQINAFKEGRGWLH